MSGLGHLALVFVEQDDLRIERHRAGLQVASDAGSAALSRASGSTRLLRHGGTSTAASRRA